MDKKFIDAEKFKNAIKENKLMAREAATRRILEMLEKQPHADVQEVKHGHWIKTEDFTMIEQYAVYEYECSKCGAHAHYGIDNYCYHCGARMDGDENAKTNLRKP